jgi:transcriptional regulator with GAF, ATPase, and Fis domain
MAEGEIRVPQPEFSNACSAVARALVTSLPLDQIVAHLDAAARLVFPFAAMGLWHADAGDDRLTLVLGPGYSQHLDTQTRALKRSDHSPRLWPVPGRPPVCIGDAARELDPAFPLDRWLVEHDYPSVLGIALGTEGRQLGVLYFIDRARNAYGLAHAGALGPLADLATLAVEHEQLRTFMDERRRRRKTLDALLKTLAEALDVQTVFSNMSAAVRPLLSHDHLSLGLITPDGAVKMHASSAGSFARAPEFRLTSDQGDAFFQASLQWDFYIVRDCTMLPDDRVRALTLNPRDGEPLYVEFRPHPYFLRVYKNRNVRSLLRVPVRLRGEVAAVLIFTSARPNLYGEEDAEVGQRIADVMALALAHERLAEEAARARQAQRQAAQLQERVDALVEELEGITTHRALGHSRQWRDILTAATKVAETDTTVLITGESGTGKEVVARYIHRASRRAKRPFVALNCAALPEQLLESELFGHERGAFTGAQTARAGRVEQAAGGVLFLDEVGEMSSPVQAKFLRLLQEREFQRLGGAHTLHADVRVIAATNRDPRIAMERGVLREDLYYRLGVFEITLPPLRERAEDILVLAEAFLEEIGRSVGRPAAGLSKDARDALLRYAWPGNVRELRNAVERAVILCDGGLITSEHLPKPLAADPGRSPAGPPIPSAASAPMATATPAIPAEGIKLDAMERELIEKAMAQANNNKSEAARLLGLARGQLYSKLKRYGLTRAKR